MNIEEKIDNNGEYDEVVLKLGVNDENLSAY